MKQHICTVVGLVNGFIATLLGGWDSALTTLVIFMAIDFITGLISAAMGKSKHRKYSKLSLKVGLAGLAKKFCILLMIVVAVRIDILVGTTYIRDVTCISFCISELLSIIKNTARIGIKHPDAIQKAIEVLQKRAGRVDNEIQEMIDELQCRDDD